LDSRWAVQELSNGISDIFQIPPESLMGRHLLDLDPHPSLLNLLEKAQKGVTSQGFNRFPGMAVEMIPLEDEGAILSFTEVAPPNESGLKT
jgi:hypothetical protein